MTSGRIKTYGGKILTDTGKIATADDCCCDPCVTCAGAQDAAVVTVTPPATCNANCYDAAQTYAYDYFANGTPPCHWHWFVVAAGAGFTLSIHYDSTTDTWSADIYRDAGPGELNLIFSSADISGVSCNGTTSKLEGTFDLPGVDTGVDCTGCTAHVTL